MRIKISKYWFLQPIIKIIPFPLLKQWAEGDLVILYYHLVNNKCVPHVSSLYKYKNTKQFIDDLDFLLKNFSPVALPDVILWNKGLGSLPPNPFLLTFDDGFREISDIINPILLDKGIPATHFICSAFLDNQELHYHHKASLLVDQIRKGVSAQVEGKIKNILINVGIISSQLSEGLLKIDYRGQDVLDKIAEVLQVDFQMYLNEKQPYLTSSQVRKLIDQGFTIGAHSIDHPYYSDLTLPEQLEQTIGSVKRIRETFGLDYGAFAFPHDDHGVYQEFFRIVCESGLVDITFGTGGMLDNCLRSHKQRVSLENPLLPAKEIIAWQYSRKFYKQLKIF